MADVKISALPAATTPLTGGEVLPIVQSSTTKQVAVSNLTAGLTGTASININGTVGATTPSTGAFTTLSTTGTVTFNGTEFRLNNNAGAAIIGYTGAAYRSLTYDALSHIFQSSGASVATVSSTGLAVTGTLSATGNVTLGDAVGDVHTTNGLVQIGQGTFAARTGVKGVIAAGPTTGDIHCQLGDSGATWQWINAANSLAVMNLSNAGALSVAGGLAVTGTLSATGDISLPTTKQLGWGTSPFTCAIEGASGASGYIRFATNSAFQMLLDSSGNLGIGTSSPDAGYRLHVVGDNIRITKNSASGSAQLSLQNDANYAGIVYNGSTNTAQGGAQSLNIYNPSSAPITFITSGTEAARITSGGFFKASNTGSYVGVSSNYHEIVTNVQDNFTLYCRNSNATSPYGIEVNFTATPNNATNWFHECSDGAGNRFVARSNGGLANYSANDVNLSDRREKTNFAPASSYLDKICAIPVQTFNYIDQNMEDDGGLTLGVVAQDVQAVAPELVMESNWAGKDDEPKMRLSIYQTDLQYALMKCIQEQQAIITALTTRITALEAK